MPGIGAAREENAPRRRLAERRKALGLTQEALANLMGVERTTVARWERGEAVPLPWLRPKLASALGVSADRLEELLTPGAPAGADPGDLGTAGKGPAVADSTIVPRQLPPAAAGFTGRTAELGALTKILDAAGEPGTVVISAIGGTAGVGKSALAIHWAHQAADRFPDGQLYVNLRGYDPDRPMPPGDALAGFLWALGVPGQDIPPEEDERAARYRSLLAGKRVLVVLDNAGSAEQARPLLPGSPICAVVVTSRDSLAGLVARDGAARLDLDLLPLPDSVRLLRERIGDRAAATPGAMEALAERCCRLPLALRVAAELAIARPAVPLADLVAELADKQGLLDLLDAGGDPRTAIRAVFSWSYLHLTEDTARAFRLAGLHLSADLDPYAVAALANVTLGQARRTLDALAKAHLVQPTGPGRYAMHDLLRAYARELAAASDGEEEQHAALTRLFDHYLHTASAAMDALYPAERHRRPRIARPATPAPPVTGPAEARAWLDAELATLVAVTVQAGHEWPGHATRMAATLFRYLDNSGHYPEAALIHSTARAAAQRTGDRAAEAIMLNYLGTIHWHQSRYIQAAEHLRQALALFRQAGDRAEQARVLANLGTVHYFQGRYREGIDFYRQALAIYRKAGDPFGKAKTLNNLGSTEERQGRYDLAARHLRQALAIAAEIGARELECPALTNLGTVVMRQGRYRQGADNLHRALAMCREVGVRDAEAEALTRIGDLCLRQTRPEDAVRYLREALALNRELGNEAGEADALNSLGEVLLAAGQLDRARAEYGVALGLAAQAGEKYQEARAHRGLGEARRASGDPSGARRHWRQALDLFSELGTPEADQVRAQLDAPGQATAK
ncbi:MAG TPA: tetratricopeptide repeat protein [Trebonia sp.]|jgi:tetratricopeptide (TPR) repeat protein/transcriptional regulator with XRE-family HTH domain